MRGIPHACTGDRANACGLPRSAKAEPLGGKPSGNRSPRLRRWPANRPSAPLRMERQALLERTRERGALALAQKLDTAVELKQLFLRKRIAVNGGVGFAPTLW